MTVLVNVPVKVGVAVSAGIFVEMEETVDVAVGATTVNLAPGTVLLTIIAGTPFVADTPVKVA